MRRTRLSGRGTHAGLMATAVVLLGGLVVAGGNNGHSPQEVRMFSGAAWLSSARVGQATLLDGTSAEVSAQVQVVTYVVGHHGRPTRLRSCRRAWPTLDEAA